MNNFEFDILVNGKPVKQYLHEDGRYYIEGKKDTQYSLRLKNNGSGRVLMIPSVDGLNAMTGKRATPQDTGYIVNGYDSIIIDGWRKSDNEVAQFYFSPADKSYAEKKGKGDNVGVIGCAVIREVVKPKEIIKYVHDIVHIHDHCEDSFCPKCHPRRHWDWGQHSFYSSGLGGGDIMNSLTTSSSQLNGSQANVSMRSAKKDFSEQELGTGWGETKHSAVVSVEFEREPYITSKFEIFYNTRAQLEVMGINLNRKVQKIAPSAFKESGYCEPPEE